MFTTRGVRKEEATVWSGEKWLWPASRKLANLEVNIKLTIKKDHR